MESEALKRGERNQPQRRAVHYQSLREELFSVFIDNIPTGKDVKWVRDLFSQDGEALDVFIPSRGRRVSNSRFGFVRYKSLVEAKAAIRRWNGANVGRAKLLVLLADDGGKPRVSHRFTMERRQNAHGGQGEGGTEQVWRSKSARVDQGSKGSRKFNDVSGGQNQKKRRVILEAFQEYEDWALNSLLADMKTIKLVEVIEKELRSEGIPFVKIVSAGGRSVLIQFACVGDLEKCLVEDYSSILRNFTKLQRWREEVLPKSRTVWISLLGLPFKAWTENNCERLAAPFGAFLKMDDRDVRFVGVGRARMLIETAVVERICEVVEAEISGKLYEIKLCEDCCLGGCEIDTPQSQEEAGNSDGSFRPSEAELGVASSPIDAHSKSVGAEELPPLSPVELGGATGDRLRSVGEEISNFNEEDSQLVPDSVLEGVGTSWASIVQNCSKEKGSMGPCEIHMEKASQFPIIAGPHIASSSLPGDQRQNSSDDFGNSDIPVEEDSLRYSEKHISSSKMTRRKDSKEKKRILYQRRKKLRAAEADQNADNGLAPAQNFPEEEIDAKERERRRLQREEAEETFHVALDLGIKGSLPEEEMIQIFEDYLQRQFNERCIELARMQGELVK